MAENLRQIVWKELIITLKIKEVIVIINNCIHIEIAKFGKNLSKSINFL